MNHVNMAAFFFILSVTTTTQVRNYVLRLILSFDVFRSRDIRYLYLNVPNDKKIEPSDALCHHIYHCSSGVLLLLFCHLAKAI